jgi:hypothetical protein
MKNAACAAVKREAEEDCATASDPESSKLIIKSHQPPAKVMLRQGAGVSSQPAEAWGITLDSRRSLRQYSVPEEPEKVLALLSPGIPGETRPRPGFAHRAAVNSDNAQISFAWPHSHPASCQQAGMELSSCAALDATLLRLDPPKDVEPCPIATNLPTPDESQRVYVTSSGRRTKFLPTRQSSS